MTQRRPTSFDIAALAGVSQPTVSRALSGNPSVSEATRQRVRAAAEQLNYTVDKNASGLGEGKVWVRFSQGIFTITHFND